AGMLKSQREYSLTAISNSRLLPRAARRRRFISRPLAFSFFFLKSQATPSRCSLVFLIYTQKRTVYQACPERERETLPCTRTPAARSSGCICPLSTNARKPEKDGHGFVFFSN